ncbi:hypothetical protein Leryth_021853 [Lithospermum erythrorhizon]|nr:hypothetical protein Leryth_021853 [Lithospermum erythrorhizon]
MGRKKQVRPHRSVGLLERATANEDSVVLDKEKEEGIESGKPYFVEVDRSNWNSDEHYDVSEVVLTNLKITEEYKGYVYKEDVYNDFRYFLRFRLSNVTEYVDRIKLGHWPVLSASDILVEFGEKNEKEGMNEDFVIMSANFDGSDEGVTGLVHLASLKFLTLRPIIGSMISGSSVSLRMRVEIQKSAFDECESLLDHSRPLWKKSMMNIMAWMRPEVLTSESRYGSSGVTNMETDSPVNVKNMSASRNQAGFDVAGFYDAIKPSKQEPMLEDHLPGLVSELRPYQRRAAYWMVRRERGVCQGFEGNSRDQFVSPLSIPVSLIDTSSNIHYNPFSGNLSLYDEHSVSYVQGGILADEMGLGKTVELLACILSHKMPSTELGKSVTSHSENQENNLRRIKKERIECICGAVSENSRYRGLWVQCDICDAWQHADCVGYSAKGKASKCKTTSANEEIPKRRSKRKNNVKIVVMDGMHACQLCSELVQLTESPVATGATLIVCPTPILAQWHSEILRHTNYGSLSICIYEGVRSASLLDVPPMGLSELLSADIVLTTYDVLKEDLSHDSDRHEGDRRSLRFEKRYRVIPTPLTRVFWWRLCLDEAQMVESNAAAATEMALRLHAKHRWCVTGTPIQRKLDDLYGLLKFLKASPFDTYRWWSEVIRIPYESGDDGAMCFSHKLFKQLMWRSSKVNVADELQIPPQEESVSWLSLSPIEEHFYQIQHETCVGDAREVISKFKADIRERRATDSRSPDKSSDTVVITNVEASKLFNSLLKLRQACCHPQVGSSGLRSLHQSPMTMEEILSVLIGKTKIEGEDALRKLVVALNALAGISIIKKDYPQAMSLYMEAMSLAEGHAEDFRLDPLLNIHLHHNFAEIRTLSSDSLPGSFQGKVIRMDDTEKTNEPNVKSEQVVRGSSLTTGSYNELESSSNSGVKGVDGSDSYIKKDALMNSTSEQCLRRACEELKKKFLSVFNSKLSAAQQEFRKSYGQVCSGFSERKNLNTTWWLEALQHIEQDKDLPGELTRKIVEAVSGTLTTSRKSRIASCFRSLTALKYYIQTGLDSLEESREKLLDRLLEIDQTIGSPREDDIERVRWCQNCQANNDGPLCVHCELDELFKAYEARLFRLNKGNNGEVITSAEEAIDLQKRTIELNRFYRTLSRPEKGSSMFTPHPDDNGKKRDHGERVIVSKSPSELEIVLGIIKSNSRGLLDREGMLAAKKQLILLEGMRKEYAQARFLAIAQAQVLRAHDEIKMATSRLRIKEDENDNSIDALSYGELDAASSEYSSDKFVEQSSLSRIKSQLRYLKGLAQSKQKLGPESSISSQAALPNALSPSPPTEKENKSLPTADEETCPVCQEKLGNQKMVFQCAHVTCCKCLFVMTERRSANHAKYQTDWIMCPTCRQPTNYGNIAYVDDRHTYSQDSSAHTSGDSEASIPVKGSYSTKIEAVTRRILGINSKDPSAKIIVFTSWNDVLDVLEHAFTANSISHIRMKGGR